MAIRNQTNSDFYQIVQVDAQGNPLEIIADYLPVGNLTAGRNIQLANTNSNWTVAFSNVLTETVAINSSAPPATIPVVINTSAIVYYTGATVGNKAVNFTSTNNLNTQVPAGNTTTAVVILTNGASGGVINTAQVEGVNLTVRWLGGTAPALVATGLDVYSFNLIRNSSGTGDFTIIGSRSSTT